MSGCSCRPCSILLRGKNSALNCLKKPCPNPFAALTALTPSAQLIWLWLVERSLALGFFEILGIWRLTRLGLGRFGYGQRLGLGYAPLPNNHFTHTHTGFPVVWGGCK